MLTEEQKKERLETITGTMIAGIVGVNPWVTPFRAYQMAVGEWEVKDNEPMHWGRTLEPVVAEHYSRIHEVDLVEPGFLRHGKRKWMGGTPDRLHADGTCLLEIKTVGSRQAHRWSDGPPVEHLAQVAWYQALTSIDDARLAVLIAGQEYREHEIIRDPELEGHLIEAGKRFFHDHVKARKPPMADHHDTTTQYIRNRFKHYEKDYIMATPELNRLVYKLQLANDAYEAAEARRQKLRNELMLRIGSRAGIEGPWGRLSWTNHKGRIDWKAIVEDHTSLDREQIERYRKSPIRTFRAHVKSDYDWDRLVQKKGKK